MLQSFRSPVTPTGYGRVMQLEFLSMKRMLSFHGENAAGFNHQVLEERTVSKPQLSGATW